MVTLVIYDISDDKVRLKVEKCCHDHSLYRVQKSAFRGKIKTGEVKKLSSEIKKIIKDKKHSDVQIYTICETDFNRHLRMTEKGIMKDEQGPIREVLSV
jgi:CRISPR-associated protein Cas2